MTKRFIILLQCFSFSLLVFHIRHLVSDVGKPLNSFDCRWGILSITDQVAAGSSERGSAKAVSVNMSSWVVSTTELYDCGANGTTSSPTSSRHTRLIHLVWHNLAEKCQKIGTFFRRETNKPLPKELRRSLRLNKSARRKGYRSCESEADKRLMKERLNEPVNISIRMGPAYDYRPSSF